MSTYRKGEAMNTDQAQRLERLVRDFRARKLAIRQDPELSWEKKERRIKELTDRHYQECRELEEGAA